MLPLNLRYLTYCILIFALSGCNNQADQTLRLAHITWPGYEALSLAKNRNLYKNINVITYRPENNSQAMLAFENNIVDVVALTLAHAIEVQSNSPESLMIIAALDISHGGDVIIANKKIKSVSDLADKRLGVEPSAFGAFFISRALDTVPGLTFNKIKIISINIENHHQMMMNKKVDAIATYEPEKSKILKHGGHIIFDSTRIPNEIIDVLVTRSSFAEKNPQALSKLLDGYFKALDLLKEDPDSTMLEMAKYEKISTEEFKQSLTGLHIPNREENKKLLKGENSTITSTSRMIYEFMKRKNIIANTNPAIPEVSDRFLTTQTNK